MGSTSTERGGSDTDTGTGTGTEAEGPGGDRVLCIDCAACALEGTDACVDCVVTWLVDREPGEAVVIRVAEVRALRALEHGGLVPQLRHTSRTVSA